MKGIIFHYGLFKLMWDWFVLLLVLYTAIEVPFVVAFILGDETRIHTVNCSDSSDLFRRYYNDNKTYFVIFVIDLCVDVFFFCDIIVNFRTTYIGKNDALVTSPKKIALRYLRTYFIVDLVAAIPWDVIAERCTFQSPIALSLLKTVRLLRLFQAARRLDQNYEKSISLLFLMVFVFSLVAHWLACIWYFIGYRESKKLVPSSWLTQLAETNKKPINLTTGSGPSLRSRYLTSLYFTLTCLTSVGFGNVSANTDFEKLFTIISMLIGALLFAAVFGNVSAIIYGHYSGTFKFRERMQSVKYFLGFHKIKGPLARKVKEYARHMWTQTKGISTIKVMKQFPKNLQEEISCYLHFNVIKNCPLFENAEESCLWNLATRMNRLHHLPNNVIVRQGSIITSVYFISRGRLDVCRNGAVVGTLGEGDAFGNLCLNARSEVPKSAVMLRCSCCVDIHILNLDDLREILQMFPEFSKNLKEKTNSIIKKTVLTSQILSSWDAIEVEETCPEHHSLRFLTSWLGRHKAQRKCNVDMQEEAHSSSSRKKKTGGGIHETLCSLPLVVLSPTCSSADDVQNLWRFANIIENGKDGEMNGTFKQSRSPDDEKLPANRPENASLRMSQGKLQCTHKKQEVISGSSKNYNEERTEHESESEESAPDISLHSCNCEFYDTSTDEDNQSIHNKKLVTVIQNMNTKLQNLEQKMDTILSLLEQQHILKN